ncbi:sorting nexin-20 isoform X2 [Diorhabda carinulata]|nr:sorting nexin-20 isoform X2 [Diorhabda carinulata]
MIERRYTNFLDLYTSLKKEYPHLMNNIVFPKKALTGNFSSELISARSTGFESLLKHITSNNQLKNSLALIAFLQDAELQTVKSLLHDMKYSLAYPILEDSLKLLNKVFTDRSPVVLLALVRLIACGASLPEFPDVLKWADLALHRFEGVSDGDLLQLYVPLFRTCVKLWCQNGRNPEELQKTLCSLQKQGVKMEEKSLIDAVKTVEEKIFGI